MKRHLLILAATYLLTGLTGLFFILVMFKGLSGGVSFLFEENPLRTCVLAVCWPLFLLGLAGDTSDVQLLKIGLCFLGCGLISYVLLTRLIPPLFDEGLCPSCGYDLRASPERCPECGMLTADAERGEEKK